MAKPFTIDVIPKGQLIDAKSAKTGMLLEMINKMAEVKNLLLDQLNIRNGSEGWARLATRSITMCQLIKIRPYRVRLPHHGKLKLGHVYIRPIRRAESTGMTKLSRFIPEIL